MKLDDFDKQNDDWKPQLQYNKLEKREMYMSVFMMTFNKCQI